MPGPTEEDGPPGPPVAVATAGGVATLTLDRPENRNALSVELVDALGDALEAAMADDSVRVVVLTNTGNTFCAGADLKAAAPGVAAVEARWSFVDVLRLVLDAPKPVVGRIAGHCMAGGVGLASACDLSIAADDVLIGFTEVRIGVAPAVISVECLPKLRPADARELFLTGERVSAARAAEAGLLNRAVPRDGLDAAVGDLVAKLVRGGPVALAAAKDLVTRITSLDRDEAFAWAAERSAALFRSEEAAEGIAAFRERRDAAWIHR